MRALAVRALRRMYRSADGIFAFRLRMRDGRDMLEGVSVRYTASALIGLHREPHEVIADVLHGQSAEDLCRQLIANIEAVSNLGDVAQIAWAARLLNLSEADVAVRRLNALDPVSNRHPTVERAWALSACVAGMGGGNAAGQLDEALGAATAAKLLESFHAGSGVFGHRAPAAASRLRGHVSCFADFVYPVMALAEWGRLTDDARAMAAAQSAADRMCERQGPAGQWWWHFDTRLGRIIEKYPVYAVHQDSMAPMALFAAGDACGIDYGESIAAGMRWLLDPPEIGHSLIDYDRDVIWRKVCRREPRKLTRSVQAMCSAVSPRLRAPGMDTLFPPTAVDFESRPYHMGWILYVWTPPRMVHITRALKKESTVRATYRTDRSARTLLAEGVQT